MEAVDSVLDLMDASTGPNEDKGEFLSLNLRVAWVLVLSCSPVPLTTRLIPSIVYTTNRCYFRISAARTGKDFCAICIIGSALM